MLQIGKMIWQCNSTQYNKMSIQNLRFMYLVGLMFTEHFTDSCSMMCCMQSFHVP